TPPRGRSAKRCRARWRQRSAAIPTWMPGHGWVERPPWRPSTAPPCARAGRRGRDEQDHLHRDDPRPPGPCLPSPPRSARAVGLPVAVPLRCLPRGVVMTTTDPTPLAEQIAREHVLSRATEDGGKGVYGQPLEVYV